MGHYGLLRAPTCVLQKASFSSRNSCNPDLGTLSNHGLVADITNRQSGGERDKISRTNRVEGLEVHSELPAGPVPKGIFRRSPEQLPIALQFRKEFGSVLHSVLETLSEIQYTENRHLQACRRS
jgi:hypothetical protein